MAAPKNRPRTKTGSPRLGIRRGGKGEAAPLQAGGPEPETLQEARRQTEVIRRRLLDLDLRIRNGELVEKAAQDRHWFAAARVLRDRILAVPPRISAALFACDGVADVQRLLGKELKLALQGVADALDR
jgi:hypothetical protein